MDPFSALILAGATVVGTLTYMNWTQKKALKSMQEDQDLHAELEYRRRLADFHNSLPRRSIPPSPTRAQKSASVKVDKAKEEARNNIAQHRDGTRHALKDLSKDEQAKTQRLAELDQLEAAVSQAKLKLNTILKKL